MRQAPSEQLLRLAALVRAPLLGEPTPEFPIDPRLIDFAIRRHRVGPLLHAAVETRLWTVPVPDRTPLAQHYRTNAIHVATTDLFLRSLAEIFCDAHIAWLAFKGLVLAERFYPKREWRQSNDVDILVPPADFARAMQVLKSKGFAIVNTKLAPDHVLERMTAALAKDVMMKHAKSGVSVEVHRRLFFSRAEETRVAAMAQTFAPRQSLSPADIPTPALGAGHSLYLLLHGASSRWFRLKWLVDLLPLLKSMDTAQMTGVADMAERLRAAVTVKATLGLLGQVFGEAPLGALEPWLNETTGRAAVAQRQATYLAALDDATAQSATRKDDELDSLRLYYEIVDNAGYRGAVLVRGAAWVALKAARRLF